jgi:hypothetical protein
MRSLRDLLSKYAGKGSPGRARGRSGAQGSPKVALAIAALAVKSGKHAVFCYVDRSHTLHSAGF